MNKSKPKLIIATRESPLALWQANWVKSRLQANYPALSVELLGLTTSADKLPYVSLAEIGGKGLFVKELEEALLDGRADIAVHSMKDVPIEFPAGLILPVICERFDARDAFVSNAFSSLAELPKDAIVGTSSVRRQSQLRARYPGITLAGLRGNVNTRLARLDRDEFAGIILAAAGLRRLDLDHRIRSYLTIDELLPAPGQGALGIECRSDDSDTQSLIRGLNHAATHARVSAERAVCKRLGGGCQVPLAAYAEITGETLVVRAEVARVDGTLTLHAKKTGTINEAESLGIAAAEDLLEQGAGAILTA